jgi:hypothetical protein
MRVIFGEWTATDIAVIEISDFEWRVSDLRRREEDGMAVLGFVESTKLGYEATGIDDPCVRRAFATLEFAVDHLCVSRVDQLRLSSAPSDE